MARPKPFSHTLIGHVGVAAGKHAHYLTCTLCDWTLAVIERDAAVLHALTHSGSHS